MKVPEVVGAHSRPSEMGVEAYEVLKPFQKDRLPQLRYPGKGGPSGAQNSSVSQTTPSPAQRLWMAVPGWCPQFAEPCSFDKQPQEPRGSAWKTPN